METRKEFKNRTACVAFAQGCPRSKVDAAKVVDYFKANGWNVTTRFQDASIVLVSACAADDFGEAKSLKMLSIADGKRAKDSRMVIFGCMPGILGKGLDGKFGNAITLTTAALGRLDEIINADVKLKDVRDPNVLENYFDDFERCFSPVERTLIKFQLSKGNMNRVKARLSSCPKRLSEEFEKIFEIKVVQGCLGECTYCAIRFGEGRLRSKPLEEVLDAFDSGLKAGHRVFRLVGGDVGAHGQDTGGSIVDLLKGIFARPQEFKLMWDDFSPDWLIKYFPQLKDLLIENANRIQYAGFPVQAASNRLLGLMKRNYKIEEIRQCLLDIKKACPSFSLTTHLLVGFPSEKQAELVETVQFAKEVGFRQVEIYKFSERSVTESARMPGKISNKEKDRRLDFIREQLPGLCVFE